ncbi:MAG: hypothetical protein PHG96_09110 [Kiritimatiellae bacterium]|nr:hypothetical protein [Kiritimatiellia bacterium]
MTGPIQTDTSALKRNPNYRSVFFDFEVLRHETMLTVYDVWMDRWITARTPENCGALLRGYLIDPRTVFVGFNNVNYDNLIATACIDNWPQEDVYGLNYATIHGVYEPIHGESYADFQDLRFRLPGVWTFARRAWDAGRDLLPAPKMSEQGVKIPPMSLKKWEKFNGLKVVKSPIPFTHPLPLTADEAARLAEYNKYDVAATVRMVCQSLIGEWETRCGFAEMLGPKKFGWHKTFTKLAAELFVINPDKKVESTDTSWGQTVTQFPKCLRVQKHDSLLGHFSCPLFELELREFSTQINGMPHVFKIGGAHSVNGRAVYKGDIWDIDVGGMYPSLMCLFNLCSRTMDAKKYNEVRMARMAMSKSDWRRNVYKKALNSTYGGTLYPFSDLYDPAKGRQVCVLGQLFIVDLLEKLEPYVTLIQTNTDGVYVIPTSPENAVHAKAEVEAFERRTGLVMEIDHYVAMYQRDVNNYIAVREDGTEKIRGSAFHSTNHLKPSVGQMMNRCEIMGIPFDPDQYTLEELSIVCTRDKNSRGFMIDGVETDAETIDVLPVYPLQAQSISTVKKNGGFCKARLCPDYAAHASNVSRADIDFGYFQRQIAAE